VKEVAFPPAFQLAVLAAGLIVFGIYAPFLAGWRNVMTVTGAPAMLLLLLAGLGVYLAWAEFSANWLLMVGIALFGLTGAEAFQAFELSEAFSQDRTAFVELDVEPDSPKAVDIPDSSADLYESYRRRRLIELLIPWASLFAGSFLVLVAASEASGRAVSSTPSRRSRL
jgi:hypothetical protein